MFEPMRYAKTTKIIINQEHKQSNLIFLKSNYKYKRRSATVSETEMSVLSEKIRNEAETETQISEDETNRQQQQRQQQQKKDQKEQNIISTIQNLFIIIITKMMQLHLAMHQEGKRQHLKSSSVLLNDNNDIIIHRCGSGGNDKLSTQKRPARIQAQRPHNVANSSNEVAKTTTTTTITTSAPASASCRTTKTLSMRILSILMSLFIATMFNVCRVEAGACWQTSLENGKCNEIFSLNITKSECCVSNPEFSYTNRELTSVEYFFATAIGGGMECAPCRESCKNMKCGPNKKCVKRKGRPKCICAPECGAAMRRRQHQQQQQQQQHHFELHQKRTHSANIHEQAKLTVAVRLNENEGAEKSERDIRSLSSEITNINLDLDNAKRHHNSYHQQQQQQQQQSHFYQQEQHEKTEQQNDNINNNNNQRKLHLQQSSSQRSQEKPQTAQSLMKRESFKPRRLLITANVQQQTEKPTTRRVQILSNVEMPPYPNDERHSNSNSNNNDDNNNSNNDDLSRSSTMSILNAHIRHDAQSRHKTITNDETNEFSRKKYRQRGRNHNKNIKSNKNDDDNISEVGHVHQQNIRPVEYATNHEEFQQQQQQQQQRKRKHRQRKNNNNNSNIHNNQHKLKQKDHNSVTVIATTPTTETGKDMSTVAKKSGTLQTTLTTITTTTTTPTNRITSAATLTSTLATPLNSTVSGERHFLSSMNNEHGSKIATSSATSSATAILTSVAGNNEGVQQQQHHIEAVGITGNINSAHTDDLAFNDRFYDQFSQHGFPSKQELNTMDNAMQHAHPVCGTDGRTYNTECQLKKRACRTNNQQLQLAYRGHCRTTCNGVKCLNGLTCVEDQYMIPHCIACKIDCPRDDGVYDLDTVGQPDDDDLHGIGIGIGIGMGRGSSYGRKAITETQRAVCGIDGKTYKSTCDINRMICKIGRAIAVAYPGPCRADRVTCEDINCGPKNTCLTDLLTHEPRCVSCRYKCIRKRHPNRFEDGKICGVNNRTYNSWCEMRKDSCSTGFFIDVKSSGVCQ